MAPLEQRRIMKAVVRDEYGSPACLRLAELQMPEVADDSVLIKVVASSVNAGDLHLLYGRPLLLRFIFGGLFRPKIKVLGSDFSGRVEAVGKNARQFEVGDEVFGDLSESRFGAFGEFVCAPETVTARKPKGISFGSAAAASSAAVSALQALRDCGHLQEGQKVLINGASGGVGSFAVQIAKTMGAEVTAVCSGHKVDAVRSLGADYVIDYTKADVTKEPDRYDLIVDAAAYRPIRDMLRTLSDGSTYVMVGGSSASLLNTLLFGWWFSKRTGHGVKILTKRVRLDDLETIRHLLETGKIKPLIEESFELDKLPEALRRLEERQVTGKLAIRISEE